MRADHAGAPPQAVGLLTRLIQAISFFLVTSADYTITRRLNFGRG